MGASNAKTDVGKPSQVSGQTATASQSTPRSDSSKETIASAANSNAPMAKPSGSADAHLKPSPAHYQSGSKDEIAAVPPFPVSATMRLPVPNPGADSAPAVTLTAADAPKSPGIYRRLSGGGWGQVSQETISWKHGDDDPTKHVQGRLNGAASPTSTSASTADLLIVTPAGVSVVQYQLLRMHSNHSGRDFHPEPGGNAAGGSNDVLGYNPQRLGSNVWLLSLHDLPQGDYGLLPPVQGELHSTTGFAKSIFTFHVL
jgi:hypothetical protein